MARNLPVSDFEGSLARKLLFNICSFQILREVSHESFDFTSATFRFWGRSRTKASFSHLPRSDFEGGLARKLRFIKLFSKQLLDWYQAPNWLCHAFSRRFAVSRKQR
jgi:hypothetical protein